MIGTLLNNRYTIEAELGHGGFGVVYAAFDTLLRRKVAVKVIAPTISGNPTRLLWEAQS